MFFNVDFLVIIYLYGRVFIIGNFARGSVKINMPSRLKGMFYYLVSVWPVQKLAFE
tara:strand:+ start:468 stop:635 length:168 start_codon:yes stop_codon:yes gene_type:complete